MNVRWYNRVFLAIVAVKSVLSIIRIGPIAAISSCASWVIPVFAIWGVTSLFTAKAQKYYGSRSTPEELNKEVTQNIGKYNKNQKGPSKLFDWLYYANEIQDDLSIIRKTEPEKRDAILRHRDENGKTPLDLLVEMNHTEALQFLKDEVYRPKFLASEDISQRLQQVSRETVAEHRLPSQFESHCTTKESRTWLYDIFRDKGNAVQPDPKKGSNTPAKTSAATRKETPKSPLEERKEKEAAVASKVKEAIAARAKAKNGKKR